MKQTLLGFLVDSKGVHPVILVTLPPEALKIMDTYLAGRVLSQ